MKRVYQSPSIKKQVAVQLEVNLLAGSVVTKNNDIQTTGQQVNNVDMAGTSFNHVWE